MFADQQAMIDKLTLAMKSSRLFMPTPMIIIPYSDMESFLTPPAWDELDTYQELNGEYHFGDHVVPIVDGSWMLSEAAREVQGCSPELRDELMTVARLFGAHNPPIWLRLNE